ncbi:MAG: AraC family transcriptional regulator [Lachnoclostridium sp.]|jgi:AraC-like DNA-binding protein
MLYLISDVKYPLHYLTCGNLTNNNHFVHPDRTLDCHVLIIVRKGTLHISQKGVNYDIGPNQFIILFAGERHYGYKPSEGPLSYYWVHFQIQDPDFKYYTPAGLKKSLDIWKAAPTQTPYTQTNYIMPEYGSLPENNRTTLYFVQLLDTAKRENYASTYRCHYGLCSLMLELSAEALFMPDLTEHDIPAVIVNLIEWIRLNYNQPLSVQGLAEMCGYNPTYLSGLFKKYTGYPLSAYINRTRIAVSKNLLTYDTTLKVSTIGKLCGFSDEKVFMKVFKKIEGITPTKYRNTFSHKHMNNK